jgi:hypothetical protein
MATKREMEMISLAAALVQNTETQELKARKMEEERKELERLEKEKKEQEAIERREKNEEIGLELIRMVHEELIKIDKSSSFQLRLEIIFEDHFENEDEERPGIKIYSSAFFDGYTFLSNRFQFKLEEWVTTVSKWVEDYLKGTGGKFSSELKRTDLTTMDFDDRSWFVVITKT